MKEKTMTINTSNSFACENCGVVLVKDKIKKKKSITGKLYFICPACGAKYEIQIKE